MARGGARPDLREAIRNGTVGLIRSARDGDMKLYTVLERSALSDWKVAVEYRVITAWTAPKECGWRSSSGPTSRWSASACPVSTV